MDQGDWSRQPDHVWSRDHCFIRLCVPASDGTSDWNPSDNRIDGNAPPHLSLANLLNREMPRLRREFGQIQEWKTGTITAAFKRVW